MNKENKIKALFFDIDGTLIDSNGQHASAWMEALAKNGIEGDAGEVRKAIGMGGDHLLPQLFQISGDSVRGKKISHDRGEIFRSKYLRELRETSGATALLTELKRRNYRLVVATSASDKDAKLLLEQCGMNDFFQDVVCGSDVENSKPDPDIVQAALKKVDLKPEEVVMFGDTKYDVQSAHGAQVKIIAVTSGGSPADELKSAGAEAVFCDPTDVLNNLSEIEVLKGFIHG